MPIEIIDTEKFKSEIFDYSVSDEFVFDKTKPVVLNFFATWCGPCQSFAPALEEMAEKHKDQVTILKLDIDANPEIPELFGIRSVPTTVFFVPNESPVLTMGNIGIDGLERAFADLYKLSE